MKQFHAHGLELLDDICSSPCSRVQGRVVGSVRKRGDCRLNKRLPRRGVINAKKGRGSRAEREGKGGKLKKVEGEGRRGIGKLTARPARGASARMRACRKARLSLINALDCVRSSEKECQMLHALA